MNLYAINNSTKTTIGIRKSFIDKVNYFIPNFLKISSETSFFHIKIYEDTLTQKKPNASIGINIKLPELYISKIKSKKQTKNNYSSFTFKIRPYIRVKKNNIFFLQNIIEFKKFYLDNEYGISNKINFFPFDNYLEENINFGYFKHLKHTYGINLNISSNNKDFHTKHYSLNFSLSKFKKKFISSFGYEIGGDTNNHPFIHYQKTYTNFRIALFNKKFIFLDLTPYLLYSKEYDFKIKFALSTSLNIKF